MSDTDSIEKRILLKTPLERAWRAVSDSREFGEWFGVKFDGPFAAGAVMRGVITASNTKYDGLPFEITVEEIKPERLFSFRWHPYAVEPEVDYSAEPMTLVVFKLEEAAGGVLLTVTETGFDSIPLERRAKAFAANEGGWSAQVTRIGNYLAHAA